MNEQLPKLNTLCLIVIAAATTVMAFQQVRPRADATQKVVYINAADGKVFERQGSTGQPAETPAEKLRREYPDGRTY